MLREKILWLFCFLLGITGFGSMSYTKLLEHNFSLTAIVIISLVDGFYLVAMLCLYPRMPRRKNE